MAATMTRYNWTIQRIRDAHRRAGFTQFRSDLMRKYKRHVARRVYQSAFGVYFVTSQLADDDVSTRVYHVQTFYPDTGYIHSTSTHPSLFTAHSAARLHATGVSQ